MLRWHLRTLLCVLSWSLVAALRVVSAADALEPAGPWRFARETLRPFWLSDIMTIHVDPFHARWCSSYKRRPSTM
jgi:hypothetical protein